MGPRAHELPLHKMATEATPGEAETAPASAADRGTAILAGSVLTMLLMLGGVALWRQIRL